MREVKYSCPYCGRVRYVRADSNDCFAIYCLHCVYEGTNTFRTFRVTLDPIMCLTCKLDCKESVVGEIYGY